MCLVNTNMAAATGALGAFITAWVFLKKPDLSMILNGCLAGLVAVTAPCAFVSVASGAVIGLIGGVLVVLAVVMFDRLKLDDPVGALSVHLVNGIWGTLALGLFYDNQIATDIAALATGLTRSQQFMVQLKGVFWVGLFAFGASMAFWYALKLAMGIRVLREEEIEGLDIGEHGNRAYPDFVVTGSSSMQPAAAAYLWQNPRSSRRWQRIRQSKSARPSDVAKAGDVEHETSAVT